MQRDSLDFKTMSVGKLFAKQLFPTIMGMVASALFTVIDGIFVGNGIGSDAIAAVNISAPIFMIVAGIGLMFGMGGGILASINLSRGKNRVANINLTQSVLALVVVSLLMTLVLTFFPREVGRLFGSDEYLLGMVSEYLFWFSISLPFTVLVAYSDIRKLTVKELVTTDDGNLWIVTARKKTGTVSRIRLLDVAVQIIRKYEKERTGEKVFPLLKYTTADINLKRIAEICGIERNVSFHMARHSFASSVCLSQGVPIETVSRMLGHRDIHTTQIYATVSTQKITNDMKKLSKRIAGKFSLIKQSEETAVNQ